MIMRDHVTAKERLRFRRSWKAVLLEVVYFIAFLTLFLVGGIYV
jgi:hypothetical protein